MLDAVQLANRLSTDVHEVAEHLVENVSQLLYASVSRDTCTDCSDYGGWVGG